MEIAILTLYLQKFRPCGARNYRTFFLLYASQPTSLSELCSKQAKKKSFFKLVVESCKFGVGPHSCVEYDCRCRRKPETRFSRFFSQILVRICPRITMELEAFRRQRGDNISGLLFCARFVFHNQNVSNKLETRIIINLLNKSQPCTMKNIAN